MHARTAALASMLVLGCTTRPSTDASRTDASGEEDANGIDASATSDAGSCGCAPGVSADRILVLSDDAELWSFDPRTYAFVRERGRLCETAERPYSMAIDSRGRAYVLFIESRAIRTFDVASASASCEGSGLDPGRAGFGLFGMAFSRDPATLCETLYLHSYSGTGPFDEGPRSGALGTIDISSGEVSSLAAIDYDGGELAGTGDGRLFAIAGHDPAKIVEYDRATGAVRETVPLPGFSKTNASAMAFFAGDLWLFAEAIPPECVACMDASCATARTTCEGEAACRRELICLLESAEPRDDCGGGLPADLQRCIVETCGSECLVRPAARVSSVTRLDWDGDRSLTRVVAQAPIRVVGAGSSTCVPTDPF